MTRNRRLTANYVEQIGSSLFIGNRDFIIDLHDLVLTEMTVKL